MDTRHGDSSLVFAAKALNLYIRDVEVQRALCSKHLATAAIHDKGQELQIYRQFDRREETAASIRRFGDLLPSWDETLEWATQKSHLIKVQKAIERRMEKHTRQNPVYTRGVAWEHRPVLIHAYKFEPDPILKLEIVLPSVKRHIEELPIHLVCCALRCHEYLVPEFVAPAKPPYERHETDFLTLTEYLSRTMPSGLLATDAISFIRPK